MLVEGPPTYLEKRFISDLLRLHFRYKLFSFRSSVVDSVKSALAVSSVLERLPLNKHATAIACISLARWACRFQADGWVRFWCMPWPFGLDAVW